MYAGCRHGAELHSPGVTLADAGQESSSSFGSATRRRLLKWPDNQLPDSLRHDNLLLRCRRNDGPGRLGLKQSRHATSPLPRQKSFPAPHQLLRTDRNKLLRGVAAPLVDSTTGEHTAIAGKRRRICGKFSSHELFFTTPTLYYKRSGIDGDEKMWSRITF